MLRRKKYAFESFEHEGLTCKIVDYGHSVCGYVVIHAGHPWHEASLTEIGHDVSHAERVEGAWWVGFDLPAGSSLEDASGHAQDLAGCAASASRQADRSAR